MYRRLLALCLVCILFVANSIPIYGVQAEPIFQDYIVERTSTVDTTYSMSVIHYYDAGYSTRFTTALYYISLSQNTVSSILEEVFSLGITPDYNTYQSAADDCKIETYGSVTSANLTATCGHSTAHLTTAKLRSELVTDKGAGTTTTSKVLWTGHILPGNPSSNSLSSNHTVIITPRHTTDSTTFTNLSSSEILAESRFSLLHELSHQIGAHDHYCYNSSTSSSGECSNPYCYKCYGDGIKPFCAMTYRLILANYEADELYCEGCKNLISSHLSNHH